MIFDGSSLVLNNKGEIISSLPSFKESNEIIDLEISDYKAIDKPKSSKINEYKIIEKEIKIIEKKDSKFIPNINNSSRLEDILNALILGTKDYAWKNGFEKCLVSLSGGIDSALVTYIATMAVGKENVKVVTLPSKFSSGHSVTDSEQLCKNLGIELINIPIKESHETFLNSLKTMFDGTKENNAEENLQARIRGNLIMAISNKFGSMLVSTSNKSESAVGYSTLYGDMSGGFSPLKDVWKTDVIAKSSQKMNRVKRSPAKTAPTADPAYSNPVLGWRRSFR